MAVPNPKYPAAKEDAERGEQRHVHERPCGDAPKHGARALGRRHVRHAAQGPQDDLVGLASHLPARQRMAEFMGEHDQKERQVFRRIPDKGGILVRRIMHFEERDQKPGPMQEYIDSKEPKEANRTLSRWQHVLLISHTAGPGTSFLPAARRD